MKCPAKLPLPNTSRKIAKVVRDIVNPKPIPRPSAIDSEIEFLLAKASARPKTIQLTTIKGIKIPKDKYKG
ncbi:MAG: hypothetical protein KIIPBIDF_00440 [Candidatus Methanoperedenaceae archaeon GB50]|nr:MAG: hypothetical protein KIIPBIDF_00440 [Candidatus Methanoperedenaceae archaeon GB50]